MNTDKEDHVSEQREHRKSAVRDLLLLPAEVMPRQIISLLGMGGPSFPMADHYNHIHLGF